jgi:hypothetical protein
MCAWRSRRGRGRSHGRRALRLSAFRLRFLFSFSSSLPDLIRQSMRQLRWHSASTGALARGVSMDHRHRRSKNAVLRTAMSGGDEIGDALSIARTLRRAARMLRHCECREAVRSNPVCRAVLDCFAAFAPRNDEGAQTRRENEILFPPAHGRSQVANVSSGSKRGSECAKRSWWLCKCKLRPSVQRRTFVMQLTTKTILAFFCIGAVTVETITPIYAQHRHRTWNGCPRGWTVQGGRCAPYRFGR